jgi:hypothetical protein
MHFMGVGEEKWKARPPLQKKERSQNHIIMEERYIDGLNLAIEGVTVQASMGGRRRHSGESGLLRDGFISWWADSAASPQAPRPLGNTLFQSNGSDL